MSAALADADLRELLALAAGSDTIELKLTVPESQHRSTIMGLGMDPLEAQIRMVTFFDTPDLDLNRAGVVVRARRIQGRDDDTVVKLRPVVPDELERVPGLGVEVDAMPGGYVCSASLKGRLPGDDIRRCLAGDRAIRKLFSKPQRAFYAAHAPDGLELDDLSVLGPIFVLKLRFTPQELGRRMVAEAWLYPDGDRILELSTKCAPSEMFQVAAEARAYLSAHGVDVTAEQQTKTATALSYFARHLGSD
jgi:hypothetical protein